MTVTIESVKGDLVAQATGKPDPYDLREVRNDAIAGRDVDHESRWLQVMEWHHFRFFTADQLNHMFGPKVVRGSIDLDAASFLLAQDLLNLKKARDRHHAELEQGRLVAHTEPMWRRARPTAEAFAPRDLVTLFGDCPETFDHWIRDHTARKRAKAAGLVIPPGVRVA